MCAMISVIEPVVVVVVGSVTGLVADGSVRVT